MALDINKATQPYEYYLKFIKENCRPDNRKLNEIRPCNISFNCINTVNGSALVKLGSTNVVCGISARLSKPRIDQPNKGYIICNVELPALCSSKNFKMSSSAYQTSFTQLSFTSTSIEQSQAVLSQLMQDIIHESGCVKEEDLCIKEGKLVWLLNIDLICLNNDGNVQDACCLAMVSALKSLNLYEIDYNQEDDKPIVRYPLEFKKLTLNCQPVCTTLFALEDGVILADPNKQEEDFMRTFMVICTLDDKRMCLLRKYGGVSLPHETISICIKRALRNGTYVKENLYSNLVNIQSN